MDQPARLLVALLSILLKFTGSAPGEGVCST